jgi:hypothetical protein
VAAMNIRLISALIFVLTMIAGCSRQDEHSPFAGSRKDIGVIVVADSAVRVDPFYYSSRIAVLPMGENVEVIDRSREESKVAGTQDFWYKIRLRDGISGWIYGQNIKVFKEGSDRSIESYAKKLRANEDEKVRKELSGKWWSVTGEDNFTDHILSIRDNGTYASLRRGSLKPLEGDYTIDSAQGIITFSAGASFGNTANFIVRGEFYIIETVTDGRTIKFKKLSSDPDFKDELAVPEQNTEEESAAPETADNPQ